MEHIAAWGGPFEFQLAETNWTAEEEPCAGGDAQAWAAPGAGHPALEYASIVDIFGSSCSLQQPYVVPASNGSCSGGQQQLVEYNYYNNYAAGAEYKDPSAKGRAGTHEDLSLSEQQMRTYMDDPEKLFWERQLEFDEAYGAEFLKQKMHRYPPSIRALDADRRQYTVPRVVAIGPYHHYDGDHLKEAEKAKHMAALRCIEASGLGVQDLYQEVVSAAEKINAHGLYDKDVMAGLDYEDDFLPTMFYDACFLVMYMVKMSEMDGDQVLFDFFESNDNDIAHDTMLLDNQIPWPVVDAVMTKLRMPVAPLEIMKRFVANFKDGCLQDRVLSKSAQVEWVKDYKALHLLGLLRFYVVGRNSSSIITDIDKIKSIQISASAIELAEMGIFLTANKTRDELPAHMGIHRKPIFFGKLSIAPLSLNDLRASWLINMAALELCTTPDFFDKEAKHEDSAVCSYLRLLCMLMHREEDVHELRTKGILQGAGLTNNKTLDFFTSLQCLREGPSYGGVMVGIAGYRMKTWGWWLRLWKFLYQNWKYIAIIIPILLSLIGIIVSVLQRRGSH